MSDDDRASVQPCIPHRFSQVKLLREALTHSSYANEQAEGEPVFNERLEFLGDAVLELCVSEEAYARYPQAPEGQMTRIRSRLVKERSLAQMAREMRLDRHILLGRGEEAQGGRDRDSLLADTLEAVIGAVFLDAGYEPARTFVLGLLEDRWPESPELPGSKDYKSRLQELTQKLHKDRPVYVLRGTSGPEHEKVFEIELALPGGEIFRASGPSMKKAEQMAARDAVERLERLLEE